MDVTHVAEVITPTQFWMGCGIFVVALVAIVSEKIEKTKVALFGAMMVVISGINTQKEVFHFEELGVDWNVIFLLIGMMVIINLMRPTGVFEYVAVKGAKIGKGRPLPIMLIFATITAISSALLDNVTTVLLLAPVTLLIADALEIDPIPFLIVEALASNIGGTATLIGDPPNIMIASKANLDFMDFIINLAPIVVFMTIVCLLITKIFFKGKLTAEDKNIAKVMSMDEKEAIQDPLMLKKSLAVLSLVLTGFIFHSKLHFEPATVALSGAALLLLISSKVKTAKDVHHVLAEVEWPVIFFFIGLFIMVGGLVKVGAIEMVSQKMIALTDGNLFATSMILMWFSAIASAIVDNIPYVATINPLIIDMAKELWPNLSGNELLHHPDLMPVWWSVALGACLGGNGSPIGASANVIVFGMAEKAGHKIGWGQFLSYGIRVTFWTVSMSTLYVCLRYYTFA
ncbi:SLC13 family permease [Patescibacteria group bacterium]